jgi:hypothetical protein
VEVVAEYRMRTSLQILKNESVPYLPFFLSEAGGHINFALTDDVTGNTIQTMTAATKLLEAMRRNPLDWRIEQLQTVARQHGIDGGRRAVAIACSSARMAKRCRCRRIARSSRYMLKSSWSW